MSLLKRRWKRDTAGSHMVKVLLAMKVLPVKPQVYRAMGGEDEAYLLYLGALHLSICPGPQIVAGGIEGGEVDKMVIEAVCVVPTEGLITDGEGRLPLLRGLGDPRVFLVVVMGDLELETFLVEAAQVGDGDSLGPRQEPVVDVPL